MTARIRFNVPTGTEGPVMNGKALFQRFARTCRCCDRSRPYPCGSCRVVQHSFEYVGGFIKRKRETGSVRPDKFGGYKTFALEDHTARVKELVAEQPDSTLAELQVRLAKENVNVSQSAISRFLHHINMTFKKKAYTRRNKIGPTLPRPVMPCEKNS